MSEFKFLCPECGQKILCDTGLSGTQIACPACQKTLTIPNAPLMAAAVLQPATAVAAGSAPPPLREPPVLPSRPLPPPRAVSPSPADPSHYSALAIASLISSVFVFFGFIPGIICGHMAKARMRKDVFLEGEKIANAGLVISYSVLIVMLLFATAGLAVRWNYHPARTILASVDAAGAPASRVVDEVIIGKTEEDHDLMGQGVTSASLGTRTGRKASRGGYFSYSMKVLPHEPMSLSCRYSGNEPKGRLFDIAIDEQVIATQELDHDVPGKFFDMEYKIPAALTRGKSQVTVEFQARPTWSAGTIFGCQMLRR